MKFQQKIDGWKIGLVIGFVLIGIGIILQGKFGEVLALTGISYLVLFAPKGLKYIGV